MMYVFEALEYILQDISNSKGLMCDFSGKCDEMIKVLEEYKKKEKDNLKPSCLWYLCALHPITLLGGGMILIKRQGEK